MTSGTAEQTTLATGTDPTPLIARDEGRAGTRARRPPCSRCLRGPGGGRFEPPAVYVGLIPGRDEEAREQHVRVGEIELLPRRTLEERRDPEVSAALGVDEGREDRG